MKKTLIFVIFIFMFAFLVGIKVGAQGNENNFVISESCGEYVLCNASSGEEIIKGEIDELVFYLGRIKYASIIFDEVSVDKNIELPTGDYVFRGSLTLSGDASITLREGTSLILDNAELSLPGNSSVIINGAHVSVFKSSVTAEYAPAFNLCGSCISSLTIRSGKIYSDSDFGVIVSKEGCVNITGGEVISNRGAAINNSSELSISGKAVIKGIGADIITDKPINMSFQNIPYESDEEITIKYDKDFEKGSYTEVLRNGSGFSDEKVKLISKSGKEYPLCYFEKSDYSTEKCVFAVYLPFSVKLYDKGSLISEQELIRGEKVRLDNGEEKASYVFLGWYIDEDLTIPYSPDNIVTSDIKLYAKYSLVTPTFSISGMNFTYDGEQRNLTLSSLYHPLFEKGGFYTYKWFKNGEMVSQNESIKIKNVSDSGEYSLELSFSYSSDCVKIYVDGINVIVDKKKISVPVVDSSEYTSKKIFPNLTYSPFYSFDHEGYVEAGEYKIVLTLNDFANTEWENAEGAYADVVFEIISGKNDFTEEPKISDFYEGEEALPTAKTVFGEPIYLFSDKAEGEYSTLAPRSPGKYYMIALVFANKNYTELRSEPIPFFVLADTVSVIKVTNDAIQMDYKSFDEFVPTGLEISAIYLSGKSENVSLEQIEINYQNSDSLRYGDSGVILSYGGANTVYELYINKREYQLDSLSFPEQTVEYDGLFHSYIYQGAIITGLDEKELKISFEGGGVDYGSYRIKISFDTDSSDYRVPTDTESLLTIKKRTVDLIYVGNNFVYDGNLKKPAAYYLDVWGVKRFVELSGGGINAGDGHIVSCNSENTNYYFRNPTYEFSISKADYDFSGIVWSDEEFVYDGQQKCVTLDGLPEGVNIVGYVDNEFTDSGEYTATAIISYDKINYNPPDKLTHFFKILPAEYDMSGVLFENVKVTYDGEYHYPILISEMPIGYDGSRPTFTFSMGVMHVSDGASIVKITFKEGSKNYKTPDDMVAYVEILPLRITVEWLDEDFVYDEKVKCPVAVSDYTSISVLGGEINAGKYLAEAISDNEDYLVVNNKREYTILKAENLFLEDPQIIDSFEGKSPSFNARSLFGVPNLVFYTDKNLKEKINAPKAVGIYYCIIEVSESENYNKLVSTPMRCEVKALVPVKLHARLLKEDISAFYILSDCDFLVSVEYNDESVVYIDNSLVKVTYENGDSFKKKDSFVKFAALGMEKKLSVSVDYARYDMSQVRWENTELIYDKTKKIPTITGLPEGISLIQVIGGGINVGEYDVYAIFDYDTENYFEPELSRCKMKITPKVINLMVSDYDLYLFSTVEKVNFQILGEEALYEELSLYFEVIGENIVIKTDNPNYILAGNIGNINKISRLSPNLEQDLLLLSLLMVVIVLFIIVVFRRKKTLLVLWYRFKVGNKRKKESFSLFSSNETLFLPNPPKRELLSSGEGNKVGITQKVSELKTLDNLEEEIMLVDVKRADELITDTLAKNLLKRSREFIYTSGFKKEIVNIDLLERNFNSEDRVDVNRLKAKGLIQEDTAYIKILGRGQISKPLKVFANDFSLSAIKMIALTGGESIKVITIKKSN